MNFYGLDKELIDYTVDINETKDYSDFVLNYLKAIKEALFADNPSVDKILNISEILIDYSWEKLNTNLWLFVDNKWRYLYAYSTLYKILGLSLLGETTEDQLIKLCDMGLLMSGPLLEKQFNIIINSFKIECGELSAKKCKYSVDEEVQINKNFALCIEESPSIEKFRDEYFLKGVPVIIDKQMSHWPAINKWNVEYIKQIAGKRTVPIEIGSKYNEEDWSQKLMTIGEFIERFIENKQNTGYLAQHPLFDQVRLKQGLLFLFF